MWIIPTKCQPYSAYAAATVDSKEELTSLEPSTLSSLMWRGKPTAPQTWSLKWKREFWVRRLFGSTLKPSMWFLFEAQLIFSLRAIRASRSQRQADAGAPTTPATCGRTSKTSSKPLDPCASSWKTSKGTCRLDSPQCSAIWKQMVTEQRGRYSARMKSARPIDGDASSSWQTLPWNTPSTMGYLQPRGDEALLRQATTTRRGRSEPATLREQVHPRARAVYQQAKNWPTPTARDVKGKSGAGRQARKGNPLDTLPNAVAGQPESGNPNTTGKPLASSGNLNPAWVEQLMGLPLNWSQIETAWTESDC